MTAQPTNPTITRCTAHAIRRYARVRLAKPFRRMLIQKLHPKRRRVDTSYFDYHTRGEIL